MRLPMFTLILPLALRLSLHLALACSQDKGTSTRRMTAGGVPSAKSAVSANSVLDPGSDPVAEANETNMGSQVEGAAQRNASERGLPLAESLQVVDSYLKFKNGPSDDPNPQGGTMADDPEPNPAPAPKPATQVIYRLFNGRDHFLTPNPTEGTNVGYKLEGPAFRVLAAPVAASVAIYRCYVPSVGDHFVSTDPACEGQTAEGLYGYLHGSPNEGTAVYRCYKDGDHLTTVSKSECEQSSYVVEGVLGYAPAQ